MINFLIPILSYKVFRHSTHTSTSSPMIVKLVNLFLDEGIHSTCSVVPVHQTPHKPHPHTSLVSLCHRIDNSTLHPSHSKVWHIQSLGGEGLRRSPSPSPWAGSIIQGTLPILKFFKTNSTLTLYQQNVYF